MRRLLPLLPLAFLALTCVPALAWSTKEHIQLTRIAAAQLIGDPSTPPAMKDWLRDATPGIIDMDAERQWFMEQRQGILPRGTDGIPFWAVVPDTRALMDSRQEKIAPFNVSERLLHYVDVELFLTGDQPRAYRHDLSGKPSLQAIPRDMADPRYAQAGMLPFRVEECYRKLIEQLRAGRLTDRPGQYPRDEHAARWAGFLAHYAMDNTQPHHSTLDYKSASYFADKGKAPNVHAQLEYVMADDEYEEHATLREAFWPMLVKSMQETTDPIETTDPWQATVEVALRSYDALPLIGTAAMAAAKQGGTPDHPQGPHGDFDTAVFYRFRGTYLGREMSVMEMKAHQQAWAIQRVKRLWRQAWDEAQSP